jgi:hypothetical protein
MGVDETQGFAGQSVGQVLPRASLVQVGHIPVDTGGISAPIGPPVGSGMPGRVSGHVDLEALVLGEETGPPQVPLAHEAGGVAGLVEGLGQGDLGERELLHILGRQQHPPVGAADPVGDPQPGGVLAGHDAGPGRGADGAGRIGVGEAHPGGGQTVDIRGPVEGTAVDPGIAPAQVVDQDEEDVGGTPVPGTSGQRPGQGAGGQDGGGTAQPLQEAPTSEDWYLRRVVRDSGGDHRHSPVGRGALSPGRYPEAGDPFKTLVSTVSRCRAGGERG